MSIYSFSDIELQAYKNIWIAIQNYDVHAELPAIDSEKVLTLYKKVLSESKSGYMYNQNQIRMRSGVWGSRIEFEMCSSCVLELILVLFFSSLFELISTQATAITEIMSMARKEKSVYDAVKSVYAYFVKNFEYAYNLESDLRYHSAISVFMYRKSVCEGFALAFANVLNRLGIPCGIVTGYSSLDGTFGAHAWNIVELDRKYYHLDVTWDICTKEKEIDTFDYFFLDDSLVRKDHQWNDPSIPVASDSTKEFYKKNKCCCINEQECISVITVGLRQRKTNISFRFIGNDSQVIINMQNIKRLFELAVNRGHFVYRSVLLSVNSMGGTAHFSLTY